MPPPPDLRGYPSVNYPGQGPGTPQPQMGVDPLDLPYQPAWQKGRANGYAALDANGRVPPAQLPASSALLPWTLLPAPTGVRSQDTAIIAALTSGAAYLAQPGTYNIDPTAIALSNVVISSWPRRATTFMLADRSLNGNTPATMLSGLWTGVDFVDIVFDGNSGSVNPGAGSYSSGLIAPSGGSSDIRFLDCIFRNTGRGALYCDGSGNPINKLIVQTTEFTGIGYGGANHGAACVMFNGGVNGAQLFKNKAYGQLSSNFLKNKQSNPVTYTVQTGSTTTSIIVNGTPFPATLQGDTIWVYYVTGANAGQTRIVTANTNNTLTTAAFLFAPVAGDTIQLWINNSYTTVQDNELDYRAVLPANFDSSNSALAIEMFNGAWNSQVVGNKIYGPDQTPAGGQFWGISIADARGSVIAENLVVGAEQNPTATTYGIEVAEAPSVTLSHNTVKNVNTGSNFTNNNPLPSHSIIITGDRYENCVTNAIVTDSAPSAFRLTGLSIVDGGKRYIWFNSVNAFAITWPQSVAAQAGSTATVINLPSSYAPLIHSLKGSTIKGLTGQAANIGVSEVIADNTQTTITCAAFPAVPAAGDTFSIITTNGTVKDGMITNSTFQVREQTTLDGEGHIFGVYVGSVNESDLASVTLADDDFGPYPNAAGTAALLPLQWNKPRGIKAHHCTFNGQAPSGSTKELKALLGFSGGARIDHCDVLYFSSTGAALCTLAASAGVSDLSKFEFNTFGDGVATTNTHGVSGVANTPFTALYYDQGGRVLWLPEFVAAAADFVLSAGWGTTASVAVTAGSTDQKGSIVVTSNGTGQLANPTITFTFHNGAFPVAPFVMWLANGGTGAPPALAMVWTQSTTATVLTVPLTPVAGSTYIFNYFVM